MPASPVLFNLCTNDLFDGLSKVTVQPARGHSKPALLAKSAHELQSRLHRISYWCERWKMSLHINRIEVFVFGPRDAYRMCFIEQFLPDIDSYTHLSPLLTSDPDVKVVMRVRKKRWSVCPWDETAPHTEVCASIHQDAFGQVRSTSDCNLRVRVV